MPKATVQQCPHQDLEYFGGAPFPAWIQVHRTRCFQLNGEWWMAIAVDGLREPDKYEELRKQHRYWVNI